MIHRASMQCTSAHERATSGITVRCSRVIHRADWTFMGDPASAEPLLLHVGELTRSDLKRALALAGVRLNAHAETLLEDAVFERTEAETVEIVQRTVGELGLTRGAALPRILATAREHGLLPCPLVAGPYLRLAMSDQTTAPDSVLSNGRAPTGSVTIASEPLRVDDDYPKGFYLRVVDGQPWLRGYRCGDDHLWSPDDRFAFRLRPRTCAAPAGI